MSQGGLPVPPVGCGRQAALPVAPPLATRPSPAGFLPASQPPLRGGAAGGLPPCSCLVVGIKEDAHPHTRLLPQAGGGHVSGHDGVAWCLGVKRPVGSLPGGGHAQGLGCERGTPGFLPWGLGGPLSPRGGSQGRQLKRGRLGVKRPRRRGRGRRRRPRGQRAAGLGCPPPQT